MAADAPLPWSQSGRAIYDANKKLVVDWYDYGDSDLTDELPKTIIRAVNSHDALVAALKEIAALDAGGPHTSAKDGMTAALNTCDYARNFARNALRAAKETGQ
ncbi:MAG: hypothetical protein ACR2PW_04640 [Gammaproteobacteria bacterium]